jgi:Ca-activated chloride channel family protein
MSIMGVEFATPWALGLLVLVPFVVWWSVRRRGRGAVTFSSSGLVERVSGGWRIMGMRMLPLLRAAGLCLLVVALARPRHGIGRVETTAEAVAMQIVVDRSGSMGLEMQSDGTMATRLDVVQRVLKEFVLGNEKEGGKLKGRKQDVIGMVTFARSAETVCPLVRDPETLVQLADTVGVVRERAEDGTAIGDGVALAAARLQRAEEELKARPENEGKDIKIKSKIIVLFTDGENNAGERTPQEAAELAAQWGIKVYAVGIGGGVGYQVVETPLGRQRIPVSSGADPTTLKMIARTTGGIYREATDADALRQIYAEIDKLEKTSVETVSYTDYEEKFTDWAAAGAAVLGLELALGSLVFRRAP